MEEKLFYIAPSAEIVVFPQQDIVTTSNGVELPDDEW
jgi:hypothetical protein